jgi:PAS domain S-box-containing protein
MPELVAALAGLDLGLALAFLASTGVCLHLGLKGRRLRSDLERRCEQLGQALEEREKFSEVLMDKVGDGLIILRDGRLSQANAEALRLTGWSWTEVSGQPILNFVLPEHRERLGALLSEDLSGQPAPLRHQVQLLRMDGSLLHVECVAGQTRLEGGQAGLLAFRDLSRQRECEAESLQQKAEAERLNQLLDQAARLGAEAAQRAECSERSRTEFLANMSHELRTPLTTIVGLAELIKEGAFGTTTEAQVESLRSIEASSQHLLDLIDEILDLSRLEAGKSELDRKSVDVRALCSGCMAFVQGGANLKKLASSVDVAAAPQRVWADPRRLRQVLNSLLDNAVKFTSEGGAFGLIARSREGGQGVRFLVWDTGQGIPADKLDLVFGAFEQVDGSTARRHGGAGLGLAMVQRLVQLHGGSVSVHSEEGKGSQFTVDIPDPSARMQTSFTSPAPVLSHPPQCLRGIRTLLVEDDPTNARIIELQLMRRGCRVEVCFNGQEALLAVNREAPDFILMDVQMPVLNGIKATRQLKLNLATRHIPVVCLSGMSAEEDRVQCLKAGADDFITKPVDIAALVEIMTRLCPTRPSQPSPYASSHT